MSWFAVIEFTVDDQQAHQRLRRDSVLTIVRRERPGLPKHLGVCSTRVDVSCGFSEVNADQATFRPY